MSAEEDGARSRAMNLHMTRCAVGVLRVLIVLRSTGFNRSDVVRHAVAGQTELINGSEPQQARVRGPVRRVASRTPFRLDRRMLVGKRTLFVDVALYARGIGAGRQPGLFQLKTAVRIVAIAATHCAFQNLMMEGRRERRLDLSVATHTKLRIVHPQHSDGREARL